MVFIDLVKVGEDRVIMDQVGHSLQKRCRFLGYLDVYLCSIWFVLNGGKIEYCNSCLCLADLRSIGQRKIDFVDTRWMLACCLKCYRYFW